MKEKDGGTRASRLLIISRGAGSMDPQLESKLRDEFSGYKVIDFDPRKDFELGITRQRSISRRSRSRSAGESSRSG